MSSLIPQERGFLWSLHDVVYGDPDKNREPVQLFITEVNEYPGLLEIMLGIEGLISKRGSHASGVILFDEDPYEHGCFMRTPSGSVITQYDLHMCEAAGLTKYDFLVTEAQDKLVQTIEFLQEDGEIEKDLSLKEIYNKYFHPSVLPIEDKETWKNIQEVKILDLFQFDSTDGSQAAKKIKPNNMLELADANGLMRLMTGDNGAEQPIDKYVRFKNNINLWYEEMKKYGLTDAEMEVLKPHFLKSHGVPPSQEQLMTMLMDKDICSFSLKDANAARKIVGKKQMSKIPALHQQVLDQAKSPALGKYVWECGIGPQMGYSFSVIHALAYSFIGFQTAYIATRWNPIYWDTACLVVNSAALEGDEDDDEVIEKKDKTTDYAKIAKAISKIISKGINISLININTSDYGFKPDVKHNRILYGLKALSNVSDDVIEKIKANRPYLGIKDFITRCPITKTATINLIKAGAFDEVETVLENRRQIMAYFIYSACSLKKRITLQNFNGLIEHNLVPEELTMQIRVFNFNKFAKKFLKKGDYYILNSDCLSFFEKFLNEYSDSIEIIGDNGRISVAKWDKIYQSFMDGARDWVKAHHDEILDEYNMILFKEDWDKYASGSTSAWEMSALCFYHGKHELAEVNNARYGIVNFNDLSPEPEVDYFFKRNGRQLPIYKLRRIAGTVLAKNDNKCMVTLLTTTGVVDVKFTRDYYAMFKKQISQIQPDGTKKVMEKGWFKRGNMLLVTGFRREDTFVGKTYKNTEGHQLYKIVDVVGDEIVLQHDRYTGIEEDDD